MAEHGQLLAVWSRRPDLYTLLLCSAMGTEDHRARVRGKEARKRSREGELLLLVEEVKECGCVDRGDLAPKLSECCDSR